MILLTDGPNLLHRVTWVAQNRSLINQKGDDVGATFTFLKSLFSFFNRFHPQECYMVWDRGHVDGNYRKTLTEGTYKAGRDKTNQNTIVENETKLLPVLNSLGILNFYSEQLEADDAIAWLAMTFKRQNKSSTIISCDKDFLQLVQPHVQIFNPAKQQIYNTENFERLLKVKPEDYLRYKAMIGDPADNLKREELKGIGPKTAVDIIKGSKTLTKDQEKAISDLMHLMSLTEGVLTHPNELRFYEEQYCSLKRDQQDFDAFRMFCKENNFKSILDSFERWKQAFRRNNLVDLINSLSS